MPNALSIDRRARPTPALTTRSSVNSVRGSKTRRTSIVVELPTDGFAAHTSRNRTQAIVRVKCARQPGGTPLVCGGPLFWRFGHGGPPRLQMYSQQQIYQFILTRASPSYLMEMIQPRAVVRLRWFAARVADNLSLVWRSDWPFRGTTSWWIRLARDEGTCFHGEWRELRSSQPASRRAFQSARCDHNAFTSSRSTTGQPANNTRGQEGPVAWTTGPIYEYVSAAKATTRCRTCWSGYRVTEQQSVPAFDADDSPVTPPERGPPRRGVPAAQPRGGVSPVPRLTIPFAFGGVRNATLTCRAGDARDRSTTRTPTGPEAPTPSHAKSRHDGVPRPPRSCYSLAAPAPSATPSPTPIRRRSRVLDASGVGAP